MDIILYALFILALVISAYAQIKVSSTFNKYSRVFTGHGRTASDAARMILDSHGLYYVRIERVGGHLTDHFDPRDNVLRLSESVYGSTSASAVGVAAHEAGHAIQHAENYLPIVFRSKLVPITGFASRFTWILILLGSLLMAVGYLGEIGYYCMLAGVGLFSVTTVFQLVTLPCEYNASSRAMSELASCGWYTEQELKASRKVLSAAALTYVAALLVSVIQLLRFILLLMSRNNRR
jgi:Zn-dependent membrane protease YugP